MWQSFDEKTWPQSRRREYLLRQDILKPLSTDGMVWASIRYMEPTNPGVWPGGERYSDWYPQDLRFLRQYVKRQDISGPYWIIGISVLTSNPLTGEQVPFSDVMNYLMAASPKPATRDAAWPLLGFDVSDGALLSGLSNCGYKPEEIKTVRGRWAAHLNRYHLFVDAGVAWQFKEFTDGRVPEHQPFYVFGLWLIEQVPVQSLQEGI
jgi:hypothetical protein